MSGYSGSSGGQLPALGGGEGSVKTALASTGPRDVWGPWTTVIGALTVSAKGLLVVFIPAGGISLGVKLAIGPGGGETLLHGPVTTSSVIAFYLPFAIPVGTRISAALVNFADNSTPGATIAISTVA